MSTTNVHVKINANTDSVTKAIDAVLPTICTTEDDDWETADFVGQWIETEYKNEFPKIRIQRMNPNHPWPHQSVLERGIGVELIYIGHTGDIRYYQALD